MLRQRTAILKPGRIGAKPVRRHGIGNRLGEYGAAEIFLADEQYFLQRLDLPNFLMAANMPHNNLQLAYTYIERFPRRAVPAWEKQQKKEPLKNGSRS